MFSCSKNVGTMNSAKGHEGRDQLDAVLDNLLNNGDEVSSHDNFPETQTVVRQYLLCS